MLESCFPILSPEQHNIVTGITYQARIRSQNFATLDPSRYTRLQQLHYPAERSAYQRVKIRDKGTGVQFREICVPTSDATEQELFHGCPIVGNLCAARFACNRRTSL